MTSVFWQLQAANYVRKFRRLRVEFTSARPRLLAFVKPGSPSARRWLVSRVQGGCSRRLKWTC